MEENREDALTLGVVSQGMMGAPSVYALPNLKAVAFDRLCESGLMKEILRTGSSLRLELIVPDAANSAGFKPGLNVHSCEPEKTFKSGDTILIRLVDLSVAG